MTKAFNIGGRLKSFRFAINGIVILVRTQHNAWLHLLGTAGVIVLGFTFEVSLGDWCFLTLAMGMVWIAEGLNTAIEFLADAVTLEQHPLIGKAKDVAAGAVLLSAIAATAIGLLVFLPHF